MNPNLLANAANQVSSANPAYTSDMFAADFPGVVGVPSGILAQFITMANGTVTQARWAESWQYGMGLFVAHWATLYLQAYNPAAATGADSVQAGAPTGLLTALKSDSESVAFDHAVLLEGAKTWGQWNATAYGRQFATLARMFGLGGAWIG